MGRLRQENGKNGKERERIVEDEHEGARPQCEKKKRIPREKFRESRRGETKKEN